VRSLWQAWEKSLSLARPARGKALARCRRLQSRRPFTSFCVLSAHLAHIDVPRSLTAGSVTLLSVTVTANRGLRPLRVGAWGGRRALLPAIPHYWSLIRGRRSEKHAPRATASGDAAKRGQTTPDMLLSPSIGSGYPVIAAASAHGQCDAAHGCAWRRASTQQALSRAPPPNAGSGHHQAGMARLMAGSQLNSSAS
jgi:hypothetical protein